MVVGMRDKGNWAHGKQHREGKFSSATEETKAGELNWGKRIRW